MGPARRRRGRILAAVLAAVLVTAGVALAASLAVPRTDVVDADHPVDAVVVLGGRRDSVGAAYPLVISGATRHVVLSNPYGEWAPGEAVLEPCDDEHRSPVVECFVPQPATTRGEARVIAALAAERGWDSVAVLVPGYHVARARYIVGRCYDGDLRMVATGYRPNPLEWVFQFAYQAAGWVRAVATQRGC